MFVVFSMGFNSPHVEVKLPDGIDVFELVDRVNDRLSQVYGDGRRHFIRLIGDYEWTKPYPRHSLIEFSSEDDDCVYADAEGPWWLYDPATCTSAASDAFSDAFRIVLKVIQVVFRIWT